MIVVGKTRWIGCRPQALLHLPAAVRARRREGGVHAAAAFRGGVCGCYLVVVLLVDGEEEDVAVGGGAGGDLLQLNGQIVCGIGLATIIWKA